jgi:hypothetical protein
VEDLRANDFNMDIPNPNMGTSSANGGTSAAAMLERMIELEQRVLAELDALSRMSRGQ